MKYKITLLCICIFLLTGCTASEEKKMMLSYEDYTGVTDAGITIDDSLKADLLSKDLCVIEKGTDTGGDAALTAKAALLVDVTDKKAIYADGIYDKLYPASITKITTALVVLKYGKLDDTTTIAKTNGGITESGAKLCGFEKGDVVSVKDLLGAFLVYSGNDAGVALAEYVSGSVDDFVKLMNEEAQRIGAVGTHYVNPHGLHDEDHYTTAYDIYLVFNELLKYDDFKELCGLKSITVDYKRSDGSAASKTFEATDAFIIDSKTTSEGYTVTIPDGLSVLGGKTGTTSKAGSCLTLYCKDSSGKEYISVVLYANNSTDLYKQMEHLISLYNVSG